MTANFPQDPTQITHDHVHNGVLTLSPAQLTRKTAAQIQALGTDIEIKVVISALPKGGTTFSSYLLKNCSNITSVKLPEGLTRIKGEAFCNCTNLTDITLPEDLSIVNDLAFYNCPKLINMTLPKGLTTINRLVFYKCTSLTRITFPSGLKIILNQAFAYCTNLERVNLPKGLTRIDRGAFYGCTNLKHITLPEDVTTTADDAFDNCHPDLTIAFASTDEQAFNQAVNRLPAVYQGKVIPFDISAPQERYRQMALEQVLPKAITPLASSLDICHGNLAATSKFFNRRYNNTGKNSHPVLNNQSLVGHINTFLNNNHHPAVVHLREKIRKEPYQLPLLSGDNAINDFKQAVNKLIIEKFPDFTENIIAELNSETPALVQLSSPAPTL